MSSVFRSGAVRVRVPASSANLGPGFDSFAVALGLYDEVEVRVADRPGVAVVVAGEGAGALPEDRENLVVQAMTAAHRLLGDAPPGLWIRCSNRIPQGRGLGSSAAAIVAGLAAARAVRLDGGQALDDPTLLAQAAGLEGHPDNVAACLHGGLTIAWCDPSPRAVRLEPEPAIAAVAFVPAEAVATAHARRLLPETVPHRDAAHAVARAGLLVEALTRRPELLFAATEDRLHQDYRSAAMPASAALLRALRSGGVPAVLSGAGPTVLALTSAGSAESLRSRTPAGFRALRLPLDSKGVQVLLA
jgi:homoserine kinase